MREINRIIRRRYCQRKALGRKALGNVRFVCDIVGSGQKKPPREYGVRAPESIKTTGNARKEGPQMEAVHVHPEWSHAPITVAALGGRRPLRSRWPSTWQARRPWWTPPPARAGAHDRLPEPQPTQSLCQKGMRGRYAGPHLLRRGAGDPPPRVPTGACS